MNTGHLPRNREEWPEPEYPVVKPPRARPTLRERLSGHFWSAFAAFDKWLYWQLQSWKERA